MLLQHLGISPEHVPYFLSLFDLCLSVDSQVLSCIGVFRCLLPLWSVKTFHVGMSGETNSGTLSITRARSKYGNPQKSEACPAFGLFNPRVSHSFISRVRAESHDVLDKVMLLYLIVHLPPNYSCSECWGVHIDVVIGYS